MLFGNYISLLNFMLHSCVQTIEFVKLISSAALIEDSWKVWTKQTLRYWQRNDTVFGQNLFQLRPANERCEGIDVLGQFLQFIQVL